MKAASARAIKSPPAIKASRGIAAIVAGKDLPTVVICDDTK
jgi:hypothetical protein